MKKSDTHVNLWLLLPTALLTFGWFVLHVIHMSTLTPPVHRSVTEMDLAVAGVTALILGWLFCSLLYLNERNRRVFALHSSLLEERKRLEGLAYAHVIMKLKVGGVEALEIHQDVLQKALHHLARAYHKHQLEVIKAQQSHGFDTEYYQATMQMCQKAKDDYWGLSKKLAKLKGQPEGKCEKSWKDDLPEDLKGTLHTHF